MILPRVGRMTPEKRIKQIQSTENASAGLGKLADQVRKLHCYLPLSTQFRRPPARPPGLLSNGLRHGSGLHGAPSHGGSHRSRIENCQ
jgi:hypothetical protein